MIAKCKGPYSVEYGPISRGARQEILTDLAGLTFANVQAHAAVICLTDVYPPEIDEIKDVMDRKPEWLLECISPAHYHLIPKLKP